jgi:alkanesulfonate monooxygenase SsuD/methylene tetrahydromethanopterin reductase-like flavin-dependent oxidoreductase (luciferase family)
MDEFIGAMRALWSMDEPEFHGRHVDFAGVDAHPRPVQAAGPPVIIGGLSGLARRRAIRTANGWFAYNTTPDSMRDTLEVIAKETEQIGRPPELGPLELTIIPAGPFDRSVAEQYANSASIASSSSLAPTHRPTHLMYPCRSTRSGTRSTRLPPIWTSEIDW